MIKSYTDISQSKKLAEILPLESADMFMFNNVGESGKVDGTNTSVIFKEYFNPLAEAPEILPCWSLAALLGVLPNGIVINKDSQNGKYHFSSTHIGTYITSYNPVDACVDMVLKLHKLKKL